MGMKIKIPSSIKLGVYPYKIRFKPNLKVDEGFHGAIQRRTEEINIEPTISKPMRDVTLLHEVGHHIDLIYECGLSEENISRFANGMAEFLFNNLEIEFDWSDIKEAEDG